MIGVISVIDVIGVIRFCKGHPFLLFYFFLKKKEKIHYFVTDVIDVIGVIGMI